MARTARGPHETAGLAAVRGCVDMALPWSAGQRSKFEWLLMALRFADRVIPRQVWILG